jgi:hypothetical protein
MFFVELASSTKEKVMRSNEKSKGGRFLEMKATPEIDFECVILAGLRE